MARAFATIVILAALGASGAATYIHLRNNSLSQVVHRLGFNKSGSAAASDELLAAGTQLQSEHQAYGTYRRSNVSHFDGMSFGWATDREYCIQVVKAGHWYHMNGPAGVPRDGVC